MSEAVFYTVETFANKLSVSISTVRRMIRDGDLRAYKIRGALRISPEALEELKRKSVL